MVMLNNGITEIRDLIQTNISTGEVGSSSQTPAATDTGIVGTITSAQYSLDEISTSNKSILCKLVVPSTDLSGETIAESVVQFSSGQALNRNVITPFTKTNQVDVNVFTIFTINP